jgi:hypothetical protein
MKKDLWNELARRVRAFEANEAPAQSTPMPFGFEQSVLRRLAAASKNAAANPFDLWATVLRPAVGLAFATAMLCVLLEYRNEQKIPNDPLTQTEALFQMAILNEPVQ